MRFSVLLKDTSHVTAGAGIEPGNNSTTGPQPHLYFGHEEQEVFGGAQRRNFPLEKDRKRGQGCWITSLSRTDTSSINPNMCYNMFFINCFYVFLW